MRDKIVVTGNLTKFIAVVDALMTKPARSDRMGLIFGRWGYGKTTSLEWFYANNPCFYVRAWAAWSRSINMMVEDLLKCYRVAAKGRLKYDLRELVLVVKKRGLPLFIDEADRLVRKSILIETIRDVADFTRVPIILIGQEQILNLLQRRDLGHVFSRITEIAEFKPLTAENIQDISRELCDLECSPKVASLVRSATLGDFRLLNAFLTKAETLCTLNKIDGISLSIAKEASKILPSPDDFNRTIRKENIGFDEPQSLRAAR